MKKVMMLTTTAYMSERFNRNNILILEEMGYEVHVVANFDRGNPTTSEVLDKFKNWIEEHHGKWISISVTKHPTDLSNNGKAYRQLKELIREHRYEFIHCHTPVAGVLGRLVGHSTKTKVMYTAHGFHFFKGAPLLNWLIYYPVERFLSRWTDMLITINKEDYQRAKKSFHARRTEYIPGVGVDMKKFAGGLIDRKEKRKSLGLKDTDIMLLSVGELNENKNHELIIRTVAELRREDLHYVIVGQGGLRERLEVLIKELDVKEFVHLLGYRDDMPDIYQTADIFVFPSKREGLSVALMEAMACGLPVICRNIRGNNDLIQDGKGGILVEENSIEVFSEAIKKMCEDSLYRKNAGNFNVGFVKKFDIREVMERMKSLYE